MCSTTQRSVRELSVGVTAPAQARRFLAEAGCPEHATRLLESAVLLVSEMVTNAVRHGAPPLFVEVDCDGLSIQVRVRDGGINLPSSRAARADDEGGRGLALIEVLSDDWGVEPDDDGKTVWFRLMAPAS